MKVMRKQAGMSQERLAEKLGVSRQAVTKWEADAGIPDIENIMAISGLFDISIDELLGREKQENKKSEYLFESITDSCDIPACFLITFNFPPNPIPILLLILRSKTLTNS